MGKTDRDMQVLHYWLSCDDEADIVSLRPQIELIVERMGYKNIDELLEECIIEELL